MRKTALIFPAFFKICGSRSSILFSFHEKPFESSLTVAWLSLTNPNSLQSIATNEIASFYIDNRLRQMASSWFPRVGKGRLSRNNEGFWNKKPVVIVSLLYKTKKFHVAVRQFSNRSQRKSKCAKIISHVFVLLQNWRKVTLNRLNSVAVCTC